MRARFGWTTPRWGKADAAWLEPVTWLTLWAVKVPDGLLASLPNLVGG